MIKRDDAIVSIAQALSAELERLRFSRYSDYSRLHSLLISKPEIIFDRFGGEHTHYAERLLQKAFSKAYFSLTKNCNLFDMKKVFVSACQHAYVVPNIAYSLHTHLEALKSSYREAFNAMAHILMTEPYIVFERFKLKVKIFPESLLGKIFEDRYQELVGDSDVDKKRQIFIATCRFLVRKRTYNGIFSDI